MTGAARRNARRGARRVRRGFTLAEVIAAVALMGGVLLALGSFTERFAHNASVNSKRSSGSDLAVERLEAVRGAVDYPSIDTYAITESSILGAPGFARQTYVRRTQTTTADHKTVTVVVRNAALRDSVVKTTVIAAF